MNQPEEARRAPTVSKWKGLWKDDKGRFVEIEHWETPEGLSYGFFIGAEYKSGDSPYSFEKQNYREGNNVLDGSKLMEKKRGEEAGWPK